MPRPRRSFGRAGTRVIPKNWAADHGAVIAKTWTAAGKVFAPADNTGVTMNADLSLNTGDPATPLYAGAMRIQQLNAQETRDLVGDQEQITVAYLVVIDRDAVVPIRSTIAIDDVDDPALTARRLVVRKVGKGSQVWERDLYAVEDQTAAEPVQPAPDPD